MFCYGNICTKIESLEYSLDEIVLFIIDSLINILLF